METINYKELARRVGDCVLNNTIHPTASEYYEFDLFSGEDSYCIEHENKEECLKDADNCNHEQREIYQEYVITESGAEYLKRNTSEIVYYCEKLDLYLWGITHYGTSWDGVYTDIKKAY